MSLVLRRTSTNSNENPENSRPSPHVFECLETVWKIKCFSFHDQKTPSWNSELKEINIGNTRPRKKVDIEVLKATNCSLKS